MAARATNIFGTWEWASTWYTHVRRGRPTLTVVISRDEHLIGVVPIYFSRGRLVVSSDSSEMQRETSSDPYAVRVIGQTLHGPFGGHSKASRGGGTSSWGAVSRRRRVDRGAGEEHTFSVPPALSSGSTTRTGTTSFDLEARTSVARSLASSEHWPGSTGCATDSQTTQTACLRTSTFFSLSTAPDGWAARAGSSRTRRSIGSSPLSHWTGMAATVVHGAGWDGRCSVVRIPLRRGRVRLSIGSRAFAGWAVDRVCPARAFDEGGAPRRRARHRFLRGGEAYKSRFANEDRGLVTIGMGRNLLGAAALVATKSLGRSQVARTTVRTILRWRMLLAQFRAVADSPIGEDLLG